MLLNQIEAQETLIELQFEQVFICAIKKPFNDQMFSLSVVQLHKAESHLLLYLNETYARMRMASSVTKHHSFTYKHTYIHTSTNKKKLVPRNLFWPHKPKSVMEM